MNSAPSISSTDILVQNPIDVDALDVEAEEVEVVGPQIRRRPQEAVRCAGIIVKIPPGKSVHSAYPFGLHDELGDPWDYAVVAGQLTLRARGCQKNSRIGKDRCTHCDGLSRNTTLQGVLDRIECGVHENTRLAYHGVGGLVKIVRTKNRQINSLRLQKLNDSRKLMGKVAALDAHSDVTLYHIL